MLSSHARDIMQGTKAMQLHLHFLFNLASDKSLAFTSRLYFCWVVQLPSFARYTGQNEEVMQPGKIAVCYMNAKLLS